VAGTGPQQFQAIYKRFGYGKAIHRDPASLSYVAEPAGGLWLLAIDSCKYEESKKVGYPVVSGRILPETMSWIQSVMQKAQAQKKTVIAFMHHGVNQHFFGEAQLFPDYLVDDWPGVSIQLAQTGLKVIFTGHYHSQDASYLVDETLTPLSPLCDVETASLAAFPCAFRIATLDAQQKLHVETRRVIAARVDTGSFSFQEYAFNAIFDPTVEIATKRLMALFGLPREQAEAVAPLVTAGVIGNYAGNENPSDETKAIIAQLLAGPEPLHTLGTVLLGLWTDLPPNDDDLVLSLGVE
jgi:hypothetical protein